jgi:hypothetical protein
MQSTRYSYLVSVCMVTKANNMSKIKTGMKVRIKNYSSLGHEGKVGTITYVCPGHEDNDTAAVTVTFDDGTSCSPYLPGNKSAQCEWVEEEKKSLVGRRVRLTPEFIQFISHWTNGTCDTGTIEEENIGTIWTVLLDNGNKCMPYSPDAEHPQCQLLPENPVQDLSISAIRGKKIAIQCRTQEEWNQMIELLDAAGMLWCNGDRASETYPVKWANYDENHCIGIIAGQMYSSPVSYYKKQRREIVQASDVIRTNAQNNNTMKQDIQNSDTLYVTCTHDNNQAYWYRKGVEYEFEDQEPGTMWAYVKRGNEFSAVIRSNFSKPYKKQTMTAAQELEVLKKSQKETADRIAALEEQVRNPYKKGDWVKWTGVGPVVAQIERKSRDEKYWVLNVNGNTSSHDSCNIAHLRPATPDEIKKAQTPVEQKITIGTDTIVTVKKGEILVDGKRPHVKNIQALIDNVAEVCNNTLPWTVTVPYVKIGCCENVTIAQLQEVVNAYNKLNQ